MSAHSEFSLVTEKTVKNIQPEDLKENVEKIKNTYTTSTNSLQTSKSKGESGISAKIEKNNQPIPPEPEDTFAGEPKVLSAGDKNILGKLNKKYAHIVVGSKHKVMVKKKCAVNSDVVVFESLREFPNYFLHTAQFHGENLGKMFLKWNGKRYYQDGVGFYPNPEKCPETVFNMFTGINCARVDDEPTLFLNHVRMVACNNDLIAYDYFIKWLAHLFQKPDEKPSVAIVFKSVEGAGKGSTVSPILSILGPYGFQVTGHEKLTGKFNNLLANKLLAFVDEVNLKSVAVANMLKGLISENTVAIELKGIDAEIMPNYLRFIFASNDVKVINAGIKERRYLVLEPNEKYAQNEKYFNKYYSWLDNGGVESIYDYLMKLDISDFKPLYAPVTQSLLQEKISSLSPAQSFIYNELKKAIPFKEYSETHVSNNKVKMDAMQNACLNYSKENFKDDVELGSLNIQLGKFLVNVGVDKTGRSNRGDGVYYLIEEVKLMRENFCSYIGAPLDSFESGLFE